MDIHRIKKGYDIPIRGAAELKLVPVGTPSSLGMHPIEFPGLKPKLLVKAGDAVKLGQPIFQDKKRPEIEFCSPAAGKISEIIFGPRRVIESIRISPSGGGNIAHESHSIERIGALNRERLIEQLLKGGLWPCIRQRPFNRIADPEIEPSSIFINCMDTAPLAADPEFSLAESSGEFQAGVEALKVLGNQHIHLVVNGRRSDSFFLNVEGVAKHGFIGRHPAGNVGTHISKLDPTVKPGKAVWHLTAREVVRLGSFLLTGIYPTTRVVALAGPGLTSGHYVKTQVGVRVSDLLTPVLQSEEQRIISGNILAGRKIGNEDYLGFYDDLISVIPEHTGRKFLEWMLPGFRRLTFSRAFASGLLPLQPNDPSTALNGERRALVQTGQYQRVMGLDVLADYLVKAILIEDIDRMEQLGILECDPEDFALCSYICPSKTEFTEIIRQGLEIMEREMS